jgi:hypothetical protein
VWSTIEGVSRQKRLDEFAAEEAAANRARQTELDAINKQKDALSLIAGDDEVVPIGGQMGPFERESRGALGDFYVKPREPQTWNIGENVVTEDTPAGVLDYFIAKEEMPDGELYQEPRPQPMTANQIADNARQAELDKQAKLEADLGILRGGGRVPGAVIARGPDLPPGGMARLGGYAVPVETSVQKPYPTSYYPSANELRDMEFELGHPPTDEDIWNRVQRKATMLQPGGGTVGGTGGGMDAMAQAKAWATTQMAGIPGVDAADIDYIAGVFMRDPKMAEDYVRDMRTEAMIGVGR